MSKDVYHLFPVLHSMPDNEIDYLAIMLKSNMAPVTSSFWAFNAAPVYLNFLLNSALIEPDYGYSEFSFFEKSKHCFKLTQRGIKLVERNFPALLETHETRRIIAANFINEVEASFRDVGLPTEKQNAIRGNNADAYYRKLRLNQTGNCFRVLLIDLGGNAFESVRLPVSLPNLKIGDHGFDTDAFLSAYVVSLAYSTYQNSGEDFLTGKDR